MVRVALCVRVGVGWDAYVAAEMAMQTTFRRIKVQQLSR
ncbi:hypothetical protein COLO4_21828 [Corchorus olitorius]|uniref:Uncharacterized protein n=1 Tax=Corchorus olitorius TaxID=93759 RepID=A0A1R3IQE5_9ROSI|nr:hypothetical protein COLO4_21828 [Corchorus olitorius]